MSSTPSCKSPYAETVVGIGFLLGLFFLALRPIESFDTFWQLQSGKYIWQTGQFLYLDTFSLASDAFRLEHCWLHDLILFFLYSIGSYTLLGLLKPIVISLCGYLLFRWSRSRGQPYVVTVAVLLLCLLASADSWLVRPQLWTFLGGVLFLILLYRGRENGWRSWVWLVPIMLAWANLHAACIFGFALFAAYWVGDLWRCCRREALWKDFALLSGIGGLVFAASFVNPYGWRIPMGSLAAHLDQTKVLTGKAVAGFLGNMEWLPPTFEQVPLFYVIMMIWALTILLRLWRRKLDAAEIFFFLGFCYMGFSQIRHTTLVAMMSGFFLPGAIATVLPRHYRDVFLNGWKGLSVALLLIVTAIGWAGTNGRLGVGLAPYNYPMAAAGFVSEQHPLGNLYNAYDWGGYLMWRLYPDYLMFVDGRSTSSHYFDASSQIENSWDGWEQTLAEERVNLIITRTCFYDSGGPQNLIDQLARRSDWALVFQDETAVVYVRRIPENQELIARFGMPNRFAYRTMLVEATRLQNEGYPRPRSWLALGRAHYALGDRAAALEAFRNFLSEVPGNREALTMVAILTGKRG